MTDDEIRHIRELWDMERDRERRVLGMRWAGPSLGTIAVIAPVVIGLVLGWSDQRNQIVQNSRTLDQLSAGFAQLSKLANDLNSDNTLQKYQIEQAQREINELKRQQKR